MLLETIYRQKLDLLKSVLADFKSLDLQPKIGIELEFYLENANKQLVSDFILQLKSAIQKENIDILDIEPEQGFGQIEVKTAPYCDLELLCQDIIKIKTAAYRLAQSLNCKVNFSSQPYQYDCGSSLQVNFSLIDSQNNFLFIKNNEVESIHLLNSVANLLKFTNNIMIIFAPEAQDYLRFDLELNKNLHKNKKYTAPVNISWGYENRTALIRIPTVKHSSQRRLEFRLAASNADIYLVITFFLLIVLDAINSNIEPMLPIYGNTFDEKYQLEILPQNYQIAQNYFFTENRVLEKIKQKLSFVSN
ncbi:Glutamine synthetase (Glutamate--ammonia ligase) [sediment metagenome]|uniref:Glutamine synthetase (Glutamate--ammonia ligase) n=1 Tax=sediment metagenome TaxID=749907 RepID=D9PN42_9ZZZZ